MNKFIFSQKASKQFYQLEKIDQQRISDKLNQLKNHQNIYSILESVINIWPASHRLRIGNFRLLIQNLNKTDRFIKLRILKIAHRKDVYNKFR
jgi:mRNA-degrading endonuclease RelE of RelBE toxin-antitoxin system